MKGNESNSLDLGNKKERTEITPSYPYVISTHDQGKERVSQFELETNLVKFLGPLS